MNGIDRGGHDEDRQDDDRLLKPQGKPGDRLIELVQNEADGISFLPA